MIYYLLIRLYDLNFIPMKTGKKTFLTINNKMKNLCFSFNGEIYGRMVYNITLLRQIKDTFKHSLRTSKTCEAKEKTSYILSNWNKYMSRYMEMLRRFTKQRKILAEIVNMPIFCTYVKWPRLNIRGVTSKLFIC